MSSALDKKEVLPKSGKNKKETKFFASFYFFVKFLKIQETFYKKFLGRVLRDSVPKRDSKGQSPKREPL